MTDRVDISITFVVVLAIAGGLIGFCIDIQEWSHARQDSAEDPPAPDDLEG